MWAEVHLREESAASQEGLQAVAALVQPQSLVPRGLREWGCQGHGSPCTGLSLPYMPSLLYSPASYLAALSAGPHHTLTIQPSSLPGPRAPGTVDTLSRPQGIQGSRYDLYSSRL